MRVRSRPRTIEGYVWLALIVLVCIGVAHTWMEWDLEKSIERAREEHYRICGKGECRGHTGSPSE